MRTAMLFPAILGLAVTAACAQEVHIKTGTTWKLDPSQSDFGSMPVPKSDTLTVMSDTTGRLSFHDRSVSADGKTTEGSYDGPEDGQLRPLAGSDGTKASFKPDGTSHWVYPDGATEDDTLRISEDGNTMTITGTLKDKEGKEHATKAVYEKVS